MNTSVLRTILTASRVGHPRIVFEVVGSGYPLLLLHGATASRNAWRGAGYVDELSRRYRLSLIDFRGHGESDKPADASAYGLMNYVKDVNSILRATTDRPALICGWSWGGMVALAVAALDPALVSGVIAIGSSLGAIGFRDVAPLRGWSETRLKNAERYEQEGLAWHAQEFLESGGPRWMADIDLANDATAMAAWCRGAAATNQLDAHLSDISRPVHYVYGEYENGLRLLPNPLLPSQATLTVVDKGTHVTAFMATGAVVQVIDQVFEQTQ